MAFLAVDDSGTLLVTKNRSTCSATLAVPDEANDDLQLFWCGIDKMLSALASDVQNEDNSVGMIEGTRAETRVYFVGVSLDSTEEGQLTKATLSAVLSCEVMSALTQTLVHLLFAPGQSRPPFPRTAAPLALARSAHVLEQRALPCSAGKRERTSSKHSLTGICGAKPKTS